MTSREFNIDGTIKGDNEFKRLICRAKKCIHNIEHKALCGADAGLEIEDNGRCIHYEPGVVENPKTGSVWEK